MRDELRLVPEQLHTPRLLLRAPRAGDGQVMYEAICASMPELKPWMTFAQEEPDLTRIEANVRRAQANFLLRRELRFLLFRRDDGAFVGVAGLQHIDWGIPKFEIGYWQDARFARQGLITEAVGALCEMALGELGARRLEIRCDALNLRSQGVPARLGFEFEGRLRNEDVAADDPARLRDTLIFARVQ